MSKFHEDSSDERTYGMYDIHDGEWVVLVELEKIIPLLPPISKKQEKKIIVMINETRSLTMANLEDNPARNENLDNSGHNKSKRKHGCVSNKSPAQITGGALQDAEEEVS